MSIRKRFLLCALLIPIAAFSFGCDDPGVLEQAGEEMDEAVEDMGAGGETLGNKLDDEVDELRDSAEKMKKDVVGD